MLQHSGSGSYNYYGNTYGCNNNHNNNNISTNSVNVPEIDEFSNSSRNTFAYATTGHDVHSTPYRQHSNSYGVMSNNSINNININDRGHANGNSPALYNFAQPALPNELLEFVMPTPLNTYSSISTPCKYYPSSNYNSNMNSNNSGSVNPYAHTAP